MACKRWGGFMASRLCPYCQHKNRGADPFCGRCQTQLPPLAQARKASFQAGLWFGVISLPFGLVAFNVFASDFLRFYNSNSLLPSIAEYFLLLIVLPCLCAGSVGAKLGVKILTEATNGISAGWYGFAVAVLALLGYVNFVILFSGETSSLSLLETTASLLVADFFAGLLGALLLGPVGAVAGWLLYRFKKPAAKSAFTTTHII
jgi:hypothetical protein